MWKLGSGCAQTRSKVFTVGVVIVIRFKLEEELEIVNKLWLTPEYQVSLKQVQQLYSSYMRTDGRTGAF
jgi:hypothetical protein